MADSTVNTSLLLPTNTTAASSEIKTGVNAPASQNTVGTVQANIANSQNSAVTPGAPQNSASGFINAIGTLNSGFKLATGGNLGVTRAIDEFGQSTLGFSATSGAPINAGIQGASQSGALASTQGPSGYSAGSFTNSLGGQAFGSNGFLGSLGSSGLDSIASGFVNTGAGFLGNLAGSALFGNSQGEQIGSTIGGVAGSYFGPIGSFAGSFLGSAIGSLFGGGGTPHPAGYINQIAIDPTTGTLSGGAFQGKHTSAADFNPYKDDFQSYLQSQIKKYGVTNLSPDIHAAFTYQVDGAFGGSKNTSRIGVGNDAVEGSGGAFGYNAGNAASKQTAYDQAWNQILKLSNIDPSSLKPTSGDSTTAHSVTIPATENPSTWEKWLADYRTAHTTPAQPTT